MLIMMGTAEFSVDGGHRYWLTRGLGGDRPLVVCGLNPSTADAEVDDNTIKKEMKFARRWGCGRLIKVNVYGFRATDPVVMLDAARKGTDVVGIGSGVLDDYFGGPGNDRRIRRAVELCLEYDGIFLAAWGKHAKPDRVREVLEIIDPRVVIHCIKKNLDGSPIHPLYQKDNSMPVVWERP
jgi:hypothetical protein